MRILGVRRPTARPGVRRGWGGTRHPMLFGGLARFTDVHEVEQPPLFCGFARADVERVELHMPDQPAIDGLLFPIPVDDEYRAMLFPHDDPRAGSVVGFDGNGRVMHTIPVNPFAGYDPWEPADRRHTLTASGTAGAHTWELWTAASGPSIDLRLEVRRNGELVRRGDTTTRPSPNHEAATIALQSISGPVQAIVAQADPAIEALDVEFSDGHTAPADRATPLRWHRVLFIWVGTYHRAVGRLLAHGDAGTTAIALPPLPGRE